MRTPPAIAGVAVERPIAFGGALALMARMVAPLVQLVTVVPDGGDVDADLLRIACIRHRRETRAGARASGEAGDCLAIDLQYAAHHGLIGCATFRVVDMPEPLQRFDRIGRCRYACRILLRLRKRALSAIDRKRSSRASRVADAS